MFVITENIMKRLYIIEMVFSFEVLICKQDAQVLST